MAGLLGLAPIPRKRALLSLRAVNSLKKVFGANQPASLTLRNPAAVRVSPSTGVTLTGSVCGSSGTFCATTVIGGSVTVTGGCCAAAGAAARHDPSAAATTVTTVTTVTGRRVVLDIDGFSHTLMNRFRELSL